MVAHGGVPSSVHRIDPRALQPLPQQRLGVGAQAQLGVVVAFLMGGQTPVVANLEQAMVVGQTFDQLPAVLGVFTEGEQRRCGAALDAPGDVPGARFLQAVEQGMQQGMPKKRASQGKSAGRAKAAKNTNDRMGLGPQGRLLICCLLTKPGAKQRIKS